MKIILVIIFLIGINCNSQVFYDSLTKKKYILVDVHKTYERLIEKGYYSIDMLEFLGNYYFKDKDFIKSKLYYDILFKRYKLKNISKKSIEQYNEVNY
jgi:hypothetical protein